MNQLNSLILEGSVENPIRKEYGFMFGIVVERLFINANSEAETEVYHFEVETYGSLADYCEINCKQGNVVRLVGRLKQVENRVFIVAEHVDIQSKK